MEQDAWLLREPLLGAVSTPNITLSSASSSSHTKFVPGEMTVKI